MAISSFDYQRHMAMLQQMSRSYDIMSDRQLGIGPPWEGVQQQQAPKVKPEQQPEQQPEDEKRSILLLIEEQQ